MSDLKEGDYVIHKFNREYLGKLLIVQKGVSKIQIDDYGHFCWRRNCNLEKIEINMLAIIAVNNLGFIGKDNKLMWHSSADLQHFKTLTKKETGSRLLVGYNTYQTLPKVVQDRGALLDLRGEMCSPVTYIDDEVKGLYTIPVICIGGKKTYEKYCHLFTELHISHINDNGIGDCTFPDLSNLNPDCKIFNYHFDINRTRESFVLEFDDFTSVLWQQEGKYYNQFLNVSESSEREDSNTDIVSIVFKRISDGKFFEVEFLSGQDGIIEDEDFDGEFSEVFLIDGKYI